MRTGSPIAAAGMDLHTLGINPGASDFYGDTLLAGAGSSIGADQPSPPAAD